MAFIYLNKNSPIFQIKYKNLGFNFNNKNMLNFKDKLLYELHISWQIKLLQKN
jgi:hypothetical protein